MARTRKDLDKSLKSTMLDDTMSKYVNKRKRKDTPLDFEDSNFADPKVLAREVKKRNQKISEQIRRAEIKENLIELRNSLPNPSGKKIPEMQTLLLAIDLIKQYKQDIKKIRNDIINLKKSSKADKKAFALHSGKATDDST